MLCRSIVYQQLSGKAAGTIMMRFLGLYDSDALTPEALLRTTDDTLRGIGLSRHTTPAVLMALLTASFSLRSSDVALLDSPGLS
jgi:3-methyladenine DNA glycosylase/8-oxoguanine DNA glycosylase